MKPIITITQTAGKQLLKIAKYNDVKNILFSTSSGGCNGYNYKFTPMPKLEKNKFDEIVPYQDINILTLCLYILHRQAYLNTKTQSKILLCSFDYYCS